jgi:23S rRNA pseudouridine1911/1915/1917 synthase
LEKNNLELISITDEMIGLRLDKALSLHPKIETRSRAEYLIDQNKILLNGKAPKSSHKVSATDKIQIDWPPSAPTGLQPLDLKLDILFEDHDVIVINKPAGLVVHPAAGHQQDTLVNALLHHTKDLSMKFGEERPGIVHRLDRDTSGIIVVAKNDKAHESLMQQFKNRTTHRVYFAVVLGHPPKTEGTIESLIGRHPNDRKKFGSHETFGKHAITHYKVLKRLPSGISYMQLQLETGRTHQIRVHVSEKGWPIAADTMYGADKKIKNLQNQSHKEIIKKFPRFALHAAELGFDHPTTNKRMNFQVDWPNDLRPFLLELGLL